MGNKTLSIRLDGSGVNLSVITASGSSKGERYIPYPKAGMPQAVAVREILESQPDLSGEFDVVQILIDTPETVFVPEEALLKATPESFLNEAGIFPGADKTTIISPPIEQLCAVMCFDSEVINYLSDCFGNIAAWFSPLQENIEVKSRASLKAGGYIINLTERNMYVTSFNANGNLLVAEALPCTSNADIVYYLSKLTEYSSAKKDKIYIYGKNAKQNLKVVKKYFKGASRL